MGIVDYVRDTKAELKHVVWPSRQQALLYTLAIIIISALFAVALGAVDIGLERLLGLIINS